LYALGIVMFVALTGESPFATEEIGEAEIDWGSPAWRTVSEQGVAFVRALTDREAAKRPAAELALGDQWFKAMYPQWNKAPPAAQEVGPPEAPPDVTEDDDGFGW
jgi:hypothetical protein